MDPAEPLYVDVKALEDRTSDALGATSTAAFRDSLIARDGTCVMTGEVARNCTACHILPHSKGDDVRS